MLKQDKPTFFILIDNFRYDQWKAIEPVLENFKVQQEDMFYSILPTATQYARNAIFSGLTPCKFKNIILTIGKMMKTKVAKIFMKKN
ncbi:MAG: PglZ domain-containing protein [Chitinophagales bacterium]